MGLCVLQSIVLYPVDSSRGTERSNISLDAVRLILVVYVLG